MNGYTEAWCLSFNQHLGRSLLVPADVSRRACWAVCLRSERRTSPVLFIWGWAQNPLFSLITMFSPNVHKACNTENFDIWTLWGDICLHEICISKTLAQKNSPRHCGEIAAVSMHALTNFRFTVMQLSYVQVEVNVLVSMEYMFDVYAHDWRTSRESGKGTISSRD